MKFILSLLLCFVCIFQIKADNASKVVHFATSKVGCGYIWAGEGQVLTEDLLKQFAKQYPDNVDPDIVKRWLGKNVYDCSGLVMKAFQTINIDLIHNAQSAWANTNWSEKGKISTYPKDRVCILYRYNDSKGKMSHTGIYIGNGKVVHAKGSKDGVVLDTMPSTWTHWGIPKGFY